MSSFQGGVRRRSGPRACSARSTPTAPAHQTTGTPPRGRRQGGQGHPDPGRPRPGAVSASSWIPAYSPEARGALGAHVRHLAEAPAPGTQARRHHRHGRGQPLPQGGLPATTQRPLRDPGRGPGHRLRPLHRAWRVRRQLCIHEERTVSNDNTVRYKRLALQIPRRPPPPPGVKARVRVHEYPDGTMAVGSMDRDVWRDTTPMANRSTAKPARPRDPLRRDWRPAPCGQVAPLRDRPLPHSGQKPATEAVNSYGT